MLNAEKIIFVQSKANILHNTLLSVGVVGEGVGGGGGYLACFALNIDTSCFIHEEQCEFAYILLLFCSRPMQETMPVTRPL